MTFTVLTLFPESFESILKSSILARAIKKGIIRVNFINIRDFAKDRHKTVDGKPYGGGAGMVLRADIIVAALESVKPKPHIILLSASGKKYNQKKARELAKKKHITILCGHYEGIDARVEEYADEILSIGDFILTGGEIPALVIIDTVTRFVPGAISEKSPQDESFEAGILEYPQYTRPENFRGNKTPHVLLTGNHKEIESWRKKEAQKRTKKMRPDLLKTLKAKR